MKIKHLEIEVYTFSSFGLFKLFQNKTRLSIFNDDNKIKKIFLYRIKKQSNTTRLSFWEFALQVTSRKYSTFT